MQNRRKCFAGIVGGQLHQLTSLEKLIDHKGSLVPMPIPVARMRSLRRCQVVVEMGLKLPPDQLTLYEGIDEILWSDWDPIGVSSFDDVPRDEYQSYLPEVFYLALIAAPVTRDGRVSATGHYRTHWFARISRNGVARCGEDSGIEAQADSGMKSQDGHERLSSNPERDQDLFYVSGLQSDFDVSNLAFGLLQRLRR